MKNSKVSSRFKNWWITASFALLLLLTMISGCALTSKADSHGVGDSLVPIDVVELGNGWATNTVNTVIFRHHGILSWGDWQFTAFYSPQGSMRFAKRNLKTNQIEYYDVPGRYNTFDAHNSISIGIDGKGFLHISYDQHGGVLRYRRSKVPLSIDQWTDELPMTGKREDRVTYPTFIMPNKSDARQALLFLYRDGRSGRGDARLKEYDQSSQEWQDIDPCILSGSQQRPWTSNPYWNHPAIDKAGRLHLTFAWRTHALGDKKRINNLNIDYAVSEDWGHTWWSSKGLKFRLPITQVNSETVWAVSPGSNLINQTSSAVDGRGRLHIVFYADDLDGVPQYQHLWYDGRKWHCQIISERTKPFDLEGGGSLQIPMSRPEIVIDNTDRVYVIYRCDTTGDRMVATRLNPPHYDRDSSETKILWMESLEFAEPVIDRQRWQKEQILSMLIQKNGQPPHDSRVPPRAEPIYIVDWDLVKDW